MRSTEDEKIVISLGLSSSSAGTGATGAIGTNGSRGKTALGAFSFSFNDLEADTGSAAGGDEKNVGARSSAGGSKRGLSALDVMMREDEKKRRTDDAAEKNRKDYWLAR